MPEESINFDNAKIYVKTAISELVENVQNEPISSLSSLIIGSSLKSLAEYIYSKSDKESKILRFVCKFFGANTDNIIVADILDELKNETKFSNIKQQVKQILEDFNIDNFETKYGLTKEEAWQVFILIEKIVVDAELIDSFKKINVFSSQITSTRMELQEFGDDILRTIEGTLFILSKKIDKLPSELRKIVVEEMEKKPRPTLSHDKKIRENNANNKINPIKIFISYSNKDKVVVYEIEKNLQKFDGEFWVDHNVKDNGTPLELEINSELKDTTHFFLIWSKHSAASKWVEYETNIILSEPYASKVKYIPLLLDDTPLPHGFTLNLHDKVSVKKNESKIIEITNKINPIFETNIDKFKNRVVTDYEKYPEKKEDFQAYSPVIKNFRKFDGKRFYVPSKCEYFGQKNTDENSFEEILNIIKKNKDIFIPIAADYGSGKSALCHHILYELCRNPTVYTNKIPVFIPLGSLGNDDDNFVSTLYKFIIKEYAEFNINIVEFVEYVFNGRFLFILDALDEMSNTLDPDVIRRHLRDSELLSKQNNTVIITCRRTYLVNGIDENLIEHHHLMRILDFEKKDIDEFLLNKIKDGIERDKIKKISYRMLEYSKKPLFLNVICENPEEFEKIDTVNQATILKILTDGWIQQDLDKNETLHDRKKKISKDRQEISEILAVEETKLNEPISLDHIQNSVKKMKLKESKFDLQQYYKDAVTSTFLSSEIGNTFHFILKPIREYFVACGILQDIKHKEFVKTLHDIKVTTPEIYQFIISLIETKWNIKPDQIEQIQKLDLKEEKELNKKNVSYNNDSYKILETLKKSREEKEEFLVENSDDSYNIIQILKQAQQNKDKSFVGILIRILVDTKNLPSKFDLSKLTISNKQYSLVMNLEGAEMIEADLTGATLDSANLTRSILKGAKMARASIKESNLTGATLMGAKMARANLSESDLTRINLDDANLTNVNLIGATLDSANLTRSILKGAKMTRANLVDADLTGAKMARANLVDADLTGAKMTRANLTNVDLTGANLTGADLTETKLNDAKLIRTDLRKCILKNTNFLGAYVTGVNLTNVDLTGAKELHY